MAARMGSRDQKGMEAIGLKEIPPDRGLQLFSELLEQIERLIKERHLDRSGYLREVLRKGFAVDRQEQLLQDYSRGELSLMEVFHKLNLNPWDMFSTLRDKNIRLNVGR